MKPCPKLRLASSLKTKDSQMNIYQNRPKNLGSCIEGISSIPLLGLNALS